MSNQQVKFSVAIQKPAWQKMINETLGDKTKSQRFVAAITSAVGSNQQLQTCDAGSILSAALLGETLNLSPSPQLGHYYMVPYNEKSGRVAQFQLGYKGYIQLAIRSGEYKRINVVAIKDGELNYYDQLTEEISVNLIEDEVVRESAETIGYYAMFELTNGFKKSIYWSKKKMESHALKYSRGYAAKKGYTFWEKDFDGMAFKTLIRQLISKWGIMSIEMQSGYQNDMGTIDEEGNVYYVDNGPEINGASQEIEQQNEIEADIIEDKVVDLKDV